MTLESLFRLKENNTSVRQELLAGLTTFMAMSYLIFVVPSMLADAGIPKDAAIASTFFVTIVITLLMGLWAKFPVGVAPGLGITAYFAYFVCGPMGFTWQAGLAAVFISGVVFFLLTVTRIRQLIIDSVPLDLKLATAAGIGAFIAFIGMKNCGLIVVDSSTGVALGDMTKPEVLLAIAGFFITAVLTLKNVPGGMVIGIIVTTVISLVLGVQKLPEGDWLSLAVPDLSTTFLALDFPSALSHGLFTIIFTLTMVDLFDNMGTLIGLSRKAGFMEPDGHIRHLDRAFITDSIGTMFSGIVGATTATSYLESAAGVAAGGRTGLTAVTTAALFAAAFFLIPLVGIVPGYATAPALIMVGVFMMQEVVHIQFDRLEIAIPSFLMIIGMPLTFNIATGFGFGFISYTLIKVFTGKWEDVTPIMYIISAAFAVNFVLR